MTRLGPAIAWFFPLASMCGVAGLACDKRAPASDDASIETTSIAAPPTVSALAIDDPCKLIVPPGEPSPTLDATWTDATRALDRKCAAGEGSACKTLGDASMEGIGLPLDVVRARALYRWGGERGDGASWLALADLIGSRDAKLARRRACEAGSASGCAAWASDVHSYDEKKSPEEISARDAVKKACESGSRDACYAYASYASSADSALLLAKGDQIEQSRCAAKDAASCVAIAKRHLCYGGCNGKDEKAEHAHALQWYTLACDTKDPFGCAGVALIARMSGKESAADTKEHEIADDCARGDLASCMALGTRLSHDQMSEPVLTTLCNANVGPACESLGRRTKSYAALARACALGHGVCEDAANRITSKPFETDDDPRVVTLHALWCASNPPAPASGCDALSWRKELAACKRTVALRSCGDEHGGGSSNTMSQAVSCNYLAKQYEGEDAGVADRERAAALYRRACFIAARRSSTPGLDEICKAAARMADEGLGGPKDVALANEYLAIACAKDESACETLRKRGASKP